MPILRSSRSLSLRWLLVRSSMDFLPGGRHKGASMAITFGLFAIVSSMISLSGV